MVAACEDEEIDVLEMPFTTASADDGSRRNTGRQNHYATSIHATEKTFINNCHAKETNDTGSRPLPLRHRR
jgi:hypothetical protein